MRSHRSHHTRHPAAARAGGVRRDPLLAVVVLVAFAGTMLAWQGWRERVPTIDLVPHYLDALAFVRDGVMPTRGTVSSYGAYNPPGTTWLLVPGVLLTDEPRLAELFASSLLYLATLLGIYMLARSSFSRTAALLAVCLYAFSEVGLFVAGTLWPRAPIQPFVVWMICWLQRWAVQRDARGLPIALAIWATGLYVFMEIAPIVLLIPICWYVYKPPVRLPSLAAAALGLLVVWWPYLAYEARHDYRDLRSILLQSDVGRARSTVRATAWCDPQVVVVTGDGTTLPPAGSRTSDDTAEDSDRVKTLALTGLIRARGSAVNAVEGVVGRTSTPPAPVSIALFAGLALAMLAMLSGSAPSPSNAPRRMPFARTRIVIGAVTIVAAIGLPAALVPLFSPDGSIEEATRDALETLRILLLVLAVTVAFAGPIARAAARLARHLRTDLVASPAQRFLVAGFLLPWAVLAALVEPGRSDRFWWLWPLAAVFLAALVVHVGGGLRRPRLASIVLGVLVIVLSCATPTHVARLQSWRANGWAGADSDQMRAVDDVASRLGSRETRIGYHLPFFEGIPRLSVVDSRFKVGAELDLVLAYKYRIANASRCAEGFSPDDEYRIVWTMSRPSPPGAYRIIASPANAFQPVGLFGAAGLYRRVPSVAESSPHIQSDAGARTGPASIR